MDHLMSLMFGQGFFEYTLDKKTCNVQDDFYPKFRYKREEWLCEYPDMVNVYVNVTTVGHSVATPLPSHEEQQLLVTVNLVI